MQSRNNMSRTLGLALLGASASISWAQLTFTPLQPLSGGDESQAFSVSRDGQTVAGNSETGLGWRATLWGTIGGPQDLGVLTGGSASIAIAIGRDGTAVTGWSFIGSGQGRAFLWTPSGGMQDLGSRVSGAESDGTGVSDDGGAVCANSLFHACRWTAQAGMVSIGQLSGGSASYATGMTGDGLTVVGYGNSSNGWRAFRWRLGEGLTDLGTVPGGFAANALGVSSDGTSVVGFTSMPRTGGGHYDTATLWRNAAVIDLGVLPGEDSSYAVAASDNGRVVVGHSPFDEARMRATVWTQETGTVDLREYLVSRGVDLTGWRLLSARGVSGDGRVIVGTGVLNGKRLGWVVRDFGFSQSLSPIAQGVELGRITRGNLASLGADDGNEQILCRFVVPFQGSPIVRTRLDFTSANLAPSSLSLKVKAKWNTAGTYTIDLLQHNFVTGVDDQTLADATLQGSYVIHTGTASGDLSRYVRQSDGMSRARIVIKQVGPAASLTPCLSLEFAKLELGP